MQRALRFITILLLCILEDVNASCYEGPLTNVALSSTPTCSSVYSGGYACSKAIDGNFNTDWAPKNQNVGAWIKLKFPRRSCVKSLTIKGRCWPGCSSSCNKGDAAKTATVRFDDGSRQKIPFIKICPTTTSFSISPPKYTSWLQVEITSVHSTQWPANSGFYELQAWGTYGGTKSSCCSDLNEKAINIALTSRGTVARCSSVFSGAYACPRAIDGHLNTAWAPRNQNVGAWIILTFTRKRSVHYLKVKGRCYPHCSSSCNKGDAAKTASLLFDDATTQVIPFISICPLTTTFTLSPRKLTSWMRVEITSVHSTQWPANSGFYEVEVWGI